MTFWQGVVFAAPVVGILVGVVTTVIRGQPVMHAEIAVRQRNLHLVIRNLGKGIAHSVAFEREQMPEQACMEFRTSSILRHGLPSMSPGDRKEIQVLGLDEEFWGGREPG